MRLCRATGGFSSSPLWREGSVSRGLACFPDNGLDGFAGACLQGSRVPRRRAPRPRRLPASWMPRVHARNPLRARRMTSQTSRRLSPTRMLSGMNGRCSGCASRIVIQGADGRSGLPQTALQQRSRTFPGRMPTRKGPRYLGVRSAAQRSGRARIRCNLGLMPYGLPGCRAASRAGRSARSVMHYQSSTLR